MNIITRAPAVAAAVSTAATVPVLADGADEHVCTFEKLASIDFEPLPELRDEDGRPREPEDFSEHFARLRSDSRFAFSFLSKTKSELIEVVRQLREQGGDDLLLNVHELLANAVSDAEALHELFQNAEWRMLSAMAREVSEPSEAAA